MRLRKGKIFMALLLIFALATTPITLFASSWDDARGQAFRARLVEVMSETHADWVIEDLEILRDNLILCDEEFYAILEMGVDAALEYYLESDSLEFFWAQDTDSGRFWYLFDTVLSLRVWMGWDDWDDWDWDDWTPTFSGIWFDVGQALRVQLVDLLGETYAMWVTEDLVWSRPTLGEAAFFEILALDLDDFIAEHMTAEEIEEWLAQEDEYDIYWDFWQLFSSIYDMGWGDWDAWDWDDDWRDWLPAVWHEGGEAHALMLQLIDILGETSASWVAGDLDWYYESGLMPAETWAEILGLDLVAALEEALTPEMFEEFFEDDFAWRRWDLWEFVIEPMIWGDIAEITREDIVATLDLVARDHLVNYDFDVAALLGEADMLMDDLVDMLEVLLITDSFGSVMWMARQWGADWLYYYIDDLVWDMHWFTEEDLFFIQLFSGYGRMIAILEDDIWGFLDLWVFDDLSRIFGDDAFAAALFAGPNMEATLLTHGAGLITILDFDLHDTLGGIFAGENEGAWPENFVILDELLSGLLYDNMDVLLDFYNNGFPAVYSLGGWTADTTHLEFWNFLGHWDYLVLDADYIEERMVFDIEIGTEIALDLFHIGEDVHLNLFYANNAAEYAQFVIEYVGPVNFEQHVLEVAPGSSATRQITAAELAYGTGMVWVMIVNTSWGEVDGQLALRLTQDLLQ